jgi:hypothetical protein
LAGINISRIKHTAQSGAQLYVSIRKRSLMWMCGEVSFGFTST